MSISEHIKAAPSPRGFARPRAATLRLAGFLAMQAALAAFVIWAMAQAVDSWTWAAWVILPLLSLNAIWIAGGAATAILGLLIPPAPPGMPDKGWRPVGRSAVLMTVCGEDPAPIAAYLRGLAATVERGGLEGRIEVFVLSDTYGHEACAREDAAFADLVERGQVRFRRRGERIGRKPGNIADWLAQYGEGFETMVVLDADSRMTLDSIRGLIWTMEANPKLGLCQAEIALVPGRTRFGRYQRLTARLLSRTFGRGFAAWSGTTGNFWGHNAIIRVDAFRAAANLPVLPGPAPFGGMILSHDFIEAAWIRRAGWDVTLCPNVAGSAEDAPQTLGAYFKRDRRWCQGNLQHLRLVGSPGLHPISRVHLLTGIFSYLAAPIWMILLVLLSTEQVSVWGFLPIVSVAIVLMIPKLCALADALPKLRTARRRAVFLRAWASELALSTLLAPLVMIRQAGFVGAVLMGRDCGWKSPEARRRALPAGWPEAGLGVALCVYAVASGHSGAFWMALVIVPLLSAPVLMPRLDEVPR